MKTFYDYLGQIRPLLNQSALSRLAKLPRSALNKHYRWADGKADGWPLPAEYVVPIVRALCSVHGSIKIAGWDITCDPEGPGIFASRPIPDREAEVIEVKGGFEYLQPQWRQVYDELDFVVYFCSE